MIHKADGMKTYEHHGRLSNRIGCEPRAYNTAPAKKLHKTNKPDKVKPFLSCTTVMCAPSLAAAFVVVLVAVAVVVVTIAGGSTDAVGCLGALDPPFPLPPHIYNTRQPIPRTCAIDPVAVNQLVRAYRYGRAICRAGEVKIHNWQRKTLNL